ncbi:MULTISPECIES: type III secretion system export apparatus subunit SctT [Pseudomonas]|uniref:Type III secretion system export apparatus subunit SctT n=1 Tax=Pseudomonas tritici TaxID=2745518 RepID=A0A8I0D158_9PSED|nr:MULTISPECIES: type III secretion system export apparatus subunit SctT [Pseudomonas]MBP2874505.1 type III secretion system export apparatus subunit SctT [Pseudomonas sp. SWRI144]MBW8125473.1 type III secretion system export apparatus subunit SctT [Pseudomonas sp. LAP_36]MBW8136912.1 type III secretion system export apparatus subunit SctT [Pseudomonas sp. PAMC 26818]QXH84798.1 type III secretion system export apparatus subunit SctT [Pseudomonas tritici]CRL96880.1 type III secretion system pro
MLLYLEFLPSLVIGMARIYPCGILVAAFCFQHIRGMPRHTIVMVMALLPAPGIHAALAGQDHSAIMLSALVFKELALGFLLGVLLAMPFWMFESVGALLDNQRGALAGGQLNPSLGPDATPIGHLFKQLAVFLLMASLGLGTLTQVIWDSYLIWPPTAWFPLPAVNGMGVFVGLLGDTFTHMMLYAAPFIAVLLLLEFGIALLGVYSQQLQVSTLAPPVKCLAGIGILLLYFALLQDLIVGRMSLLGDLKHSLGLLIKVAIP